MFNKHIVLTLGCILLPLLGWSQHQISGTITDDRNDPLIGATVRLLNEQRGAISNAEGFFELVNLKDGTYFLEFSFLGFESIRRTVTLAGTSASLEITLSQVPAQLNEIIVSANQRLQDIQSTAASVSAIDNKRVNQLQVKQFSELNSIAPNFRAYDDGTTGSYTMFASRGISTYSSVPAVGLYVDEVPYFTTLAFPLALSDIEQIEVLRGPQGTLYGRNALAGVIKIKTKRPRNQLSGFATAGYGNMNGQEFGLGLNAPLVKDKLFLRINANYTSRAGFVRNTFNGKDLQNRQTADGNVRLKYFASDRLSFALTYGLQYRTSDGYVFALANPNLSFQDILRDNPYTANFNEDVTRDATTHNVAFNATYDFEKFHLTSVTAFQHTGQSNVDEYDYTPLEIQSARSSLAYQNISEELRISSNGSGPLHWTSGIFLFRTRDRNNDTFVSGKDNVQDPSAPNERTDITERIQTGLAIYGQASYDLTPKLTATGGLRYDYEEAKASVNRTFSTPAIPEGSFEASAQFTAISPKLSLSFQALPQLFLFANAARGYRPGGLNTFVTNPADAPYDPENTINVEVGIKSSTLSNRLTFNLTGYWIRYTNQQVFTLLDAGTFNFGTDNIGESRSMGLEVESQWLAAKGLTVNMNFAYLNTEILNFVSKGLNPVTFEEISIDESGNQLPASPEYSGNININYILPLTERLNLESSVDYNYQSEVFWDLSNNYSQSAYGLLNARLGVTSKHVDFFLWGKNITNEAYFSYGYGVSGFNAASFGLPLTFGATVTGKF